MATECQKCKELARLLLEARDALPAISITSARLHRVDLTLADRIEAALEPWRIEGGNGKTDATWCYYCDRPKSDCACHLDPNGMPGVAA